MSHPVVLAFIVVACSAARQVREVKAELDRLQGDWVCVSIKAEEKVMPADGGGLRVTIRGDQWDQRNAPRGYDRIRLDLTASPRHLDRTDEPPSPDIPVPPNAKFGRVVRGVYRLDGDTLTVCQTLGPNRPKGFDPVQENVYLLVWKRAKK